MTESVNPQSSVEARDCAVRTQRRITARAPMAAEERRLQNEPSRSQRKTALACSKRGFRGLRCHHGLQNEPNGAWRRATRERALTCYETRIPASNSALFLVLLKASIRFFIACAGGMFMRWRRT